jgi:hypothetical protein
VRRAAISDRARQQLLPHHEGLGESHASDEKATGQAAPQPRLSRTIPIAKTIDRRTFLKRSGITVGAGAVASQLPFNMIGEAEAKNEDAARSR